MKAPKILAGAVAGMALGAAQAQTIDTQGNEVVYLGANAPARLEACTSDKHFVSFGMETQVHLYVEGQKADKYAPLYFAFEAAVKNKFFTEMASYSRQEVKDGISELNTGATMEDVALFFDFKLTFNDARDTLGASVADLAAPNAPYQLTSDIDRRMVILTRDPNPERCDAIPKQRI